MAATRPYSDKKPIPIESITNSLSVINSDHEAIHQGWGFSASVLQEGVADDASVYLEFTTPASTTGRSVHIKAYRGWSEGGVAKLEIVENPTLTTGNTAFTPQNRNRTGTPTSSLSTIKTNPTSISEGTVIEGPIALGGGGAGSGSGGNLANDQELVLKPATTYLFRVTNLAGSAKALALWIFWYEEA